MDGINDEVVANQIDILNNGQLFNFRGIWIPREYIEDRNLNNQERILLSVILALSNNKNKVCYAGNAYFKSILGLGSRRIQQLLAKLKHKGYLQIKIINQIGVKDISRREVKIISLPPCTDVHPNNKDDNKLIIKENKLMKKVFDSWIKYREELKRPLVNSSRNASYKKLCVLSGDDSDLAKKIVDQAIVNGWFSLYPLKFQNNKNAIKNGLATGVVLNSQATDNFSDYDF